MRVAVRIRMARLQAVAASLRYPQLLLLPNGVRRSMMNALEQVRPVSTPHGIFTHPYAPPIGGRAYGRYLDGLRRTANGLRVPLVVHLSVTDRCPCHCARCSNLGTSRSDPPAAAIGALIGRLREAGAVRVAFTGGEPLLRDDLERLVAACGRELSVQLFTSGEGLSPSRARALRQAGLEVAFVSVDDWRGEEHDRGRGLAGNHARAMAALRAFRAAGVHTVAQAVASPGLLSAGHLERYMRMCTESGAAELMVVEPVDVRGSAADAELGDGGRDALIALHQRAAGDASIPKVMTMSWLESGQFLGCQAGITFVYVAADGELTPCDFVPWSFGNAYQEALDDILARLVRGIPSPSCTCLARMRRGYGAGRRLRWPETDRALAGYQPGPLPLLMSWYRRNGHGG